MVENTIVQLICRTYMVDSNIDTRKEEIFLVDVNIAADST